MINLEVWIDGIYSTAELIAKDGLFEDVWLNGNRLLTSITEPDELFEQIFEGLDADNFEKSTEFHSLLDPTTKTAISLFLHRLRELEGFTNDNKYSENPEAILKSIHWKNLKIAASSLKLH